MKRRRPHIAVVVAIVALVAIGGSGPSQGATGCTRTYTSGTLQAFVNSLAPSAVGCFAGTFTENLKVTNRGFTLRGLAGARLNGYVWLTNTANDVRIQTFAINSRNASGSFSVLVHGDRDKITGMNITSDHKPGTSFNGICVLAGSGFETTPANTAYDLLIQRNRIHDCGDDAHEHSIYLESTRRAVVLDNYLYADPGYGIHMYPDAQGSRIEYNVIDGNSSACKANLTFSGEKAGGEYRQAHGSSNNKVLHNLITFPVCRYNVESYYPNGSLTPTGNEVAFNCVFGASATWGNFGVSDGPVGYTRHDNRIVNPLYVNRAARNYTLQAGSPCLGWGPR